MIRWLARCSRLVRRLRAGRWAVLAAVALVVTACGSSTAPSGSQAPSLLTIALPEGLSLSWWPPIVPGADCYTLTGGYLGPDTYLPLVWMSARDTVDYARSIAAKITVSDNDTRYTIQLNPRWHWSNGQPITAADVVYDAQLILAASQPSSPLAYCFTGEGGVPQDWKSVSAEGPDTVVVTTTGSVNPQWFIYNGLTQLVPIPVHVWRRYNNPDQELAWINKIANEPANPVYKVVDGPYVLTKWVQDEYWEFSVNPHFSGVPKPTIPHIMYDYETSADSVFLGLKKGTVQIAQIPLNYYVTVTKLSAYRIIPEPLFAFSYIFLNMHSNALGGAGPLFQQLYIRQALQYGIDQSGILKDIMHGFGTYTNGPVPREPKNPFYDYTMPVYYPYDPAKGIKLLEDHGWKLVNGVMEKNGKPLAFTFLYGSGDPATQDMVELLAADWAKEGIRVTLHSENPQTAGATVATAADSSQWAMSNGGWIYAPDFDPSGDGLFNTDGGFNFGGYSDPQMDRLIHETDLGGTPAQLKARFLAYEHYVTQQLPVLWLPTEDYLFAVSGNVHGFARNFSPYWSYVSDNYLTLSP